MPRGEPGDEPEPIRYAVVCAPGDACGPWLAGELRRRGIPARLVTTEELAYSTSLTHEVGMAGASTRVTLGDGSTFGPDLVGTVNRATVLPTEHLRWAAAADRDYAAQELQATVLSLLHGLPGAVLGRPDPRGLSGAWWRPAEWMVHAGRAGLCGVGYRRVVSSDAAPSGPVRTRQVLVVGGQVVGGQVVGGQVVGENHLPDDVAAGCLRLAAAHGGGVLGIDFQVGGPDPAQWRCVGGTPLPDLRPGGQQVVGAVAAALDPVSVARQQVPA